MPAFVAPLVGFALGALLAWLHAAAPRRPGGASAADDAPALLTGRPMALAALFSVLAFTPICAYFLIFSPDWSFAYLVDTRRIPSAFDMLLLLVDAVAVPAGFAAGVRLAARRSVRAMAVLSAAPLAVALLAVLVLSRRLALDGTYRQVRGDFGVLPVAGGPLGYALLWMHTLLAAGFALTARALVAPAAAPPSAAPRPDRPEQDKPAAAPAEAAPLRRPSARPPETVPAAPGPPPRRLGVGRRR